LPPIVVRCRNLNDTGVAALGQAPSAVYRFMTKPQLTRVASGDVVFTGHKERVLQLVDLRPHVLVMLNVNAATKDAVSVKFVLLAICRIGPAGAPSQPERLYPYNAHTVFKIVCGQQDVGDREKQDWYDAVALKARKAARDVVATYTLDRLGTAEDPRKVPRSEIRAQVREHLMAELADTGIEVLGAGMGNIGKVRKLDK
jgi:hypothetical protein